MSATIALGKRALREAVRQPDALFMTMFIPIFFLVVNTGQAAEIFPSESTDFLEGQGYGAFQLPITLLLAASFGMAALFLVEEIEGLPRQAARDPDPAVRHRARPSRG
jgi:ABC-2 type transport system permease protein